MISVSVNPTIAQMILSMNSPLLPNFDVGTANADANSGSAPTVATATSGSVGCGAACGSSIDTYA